MGGRAFEGIGIKAFLKMIFMMSVYHNHHTNHSNHWQKNNCIFTIVKVFDYCQRKKTTLATVLAP
jgi:hypothetical protein